MAYNQHNPRDHRGSRSYRQSEGGYRQSQGMPGGDDDSSYQTGNYDSPPYEPSFRETEALWRENRSYRENEDEGYYGAQNFRGNRDYRATQEDYRQQQSSNTAPGNRSDREQWGDQRDWHAQPSWRQDWSRRPQQPVYTGEDYGPTSGYQSAQFNGRQQVPGSQGDQRPAQQYGRNFGAARRQLAGDAAGNDRNPWGDDPFTSQRAEFGWEQQQGSRQPFGASPGWQNNAAQKTADYFDQDYVAGGYSAGDKAYRGHPPKGYERSDERIREDICERLTHDPRIDAADISVTVKAGVVTLEGSSRDRAQKYRAEDLADNISGVKDVQNRLNVARSTRGLPLEQVRPESRSGPQENADSELGKATSQKATRQ